MVKSSKLLQFIVFESNFHQSRGQKCLMIHGHKFEISAIVKWMKLIANETDICISRTLNMIIAGAGNCYAVESIIKHLHPDVF